MPEIFNQTTFSCSCVVDCNSVDGSPVSYITRFRSPIDEFFSTLVSNTEEEAFLWIAFKLHEYETSIRDESGFKWPMRISRHLFGIDWDERTYVECTDKYRGRLVLLASATTNQEAEKALRIIWNFVGKSDPPKFGSERLESAYKKSGRVLLGKRLVRVGYGKAG